MGNMRTSLYLALLPLLFGLAAAFSVHPHKAVGGIKGITSGIKLKRLIEKSNGNNELSNASKQSNHHHFIIKHCQHCITIVAIIIIHYLLFITIVKLNGKSNGRV